MASRTPLTFALNSLSETNPVEIAIDQAVIAGWTGRDAAAMEAHIVELEVIGVPRPQTTPRSASRATGRAPCRSTN